MWPGCLVGTCAGLWQIAEVCLTGLVACWGGGHGTLSDIFLRVAIQFLGVLAGERLLCSRPVMHRHAKRCDFAIGLVGEESLQDVGGQDDDDAFFKPISRGKTDLTPV